MNTSKRAVILAGWVVLVLFAALSVSTYAWMSIATSYKVSDLEFSVITENAVEIALDENGQPGVWGTILSADQLINFESELRPITWSAKEMTFYAPNYGLDGRISFLEKHLITSVRQASSSAEAEEEEGAGYLITFDIWMRTGASKITTYLSGPLHAGSGQMGGGTYCVGNPIWDAETDPDDPKHANGGKGAEKAVRIGFLTYDEEYEDGKFYIYEPNAGGVTESVDEGSSYEGAGKLIRQEDSYWIEQNPVLHGSVDYVLGEFGGDAEMFKLVANTPRRITVFIWLEGQDADCQNSISDAELEINLQFGANVDGIKRDAVSPERGLKKENE